MYSGLWAFEAGYQCRLGEVGDALAPLDVRDRVLPALIRQAAPTPPAPAGGLDPQAVAATTEGTGAGVLTAAGGGHLAQPGVATDQVEEIDPLLDRRRIDGHAASLTSGL